MRGEIAKVADLSGWGGRRDLPFETKRFMVGKLKERASSRQRRRRPLLFRPRKNAADSPSFGK
jgi:hypothetical protein